MLKPQMGTPEYNFVMGVASGMPCDADLLALLPRWVKPGSVWQTTLIGRGEIWPVHQRTAELGGMLRTGLEDTFYLPGGAARHGQRRADRGAGRLCAARRSRSGEPGRGAGNAGPARLSRRRYAAVQ